MDTICTACRAKPATYTTLKGASICHGCFYDSLPTFESAETPARPWTSSPYEDSRESAYEDARDEGRHDAQLATDGARWGVEL